MKNGWDNATVAELMAAIRADATLRADLRVLEMTIEKLPSYSGTDKGLGSSVKHYRLGDLINSHRRQAERRT